MLNSNVYPLHSTFRFERLVVGGTTVVSLDGEIDLLAQHALSRLLDDVVTSSSAVLLDLCACTFIDSAGLSTILLASRTAKARGVRLAVAARRGGGPRALFDMVIGHSLFVCCDDRRAGLEALHRAR